MHITYWHRIVYACMYQVHLQIASKKAIKIPHKKETKGKHSSKNKTNYPYQQKASKQASETEIRTKQHEKKTD